MNIYTKRIQQLLKVDDQTAIAILDQMQIDLSESSWAQIDREIRRTYRAMVATA